MRLAEEIIIVVADEVVELRPSLRHAILLERRSGSFRQLIKDITEGSLTAAVEIIELHCDLPFLENRVFDTLEEIQPRLIEFVLACAGIDATKQEDDQQGDASEARTFAEHLADLYKYGTGWLGWSPAVTLDATPAEISFALEGHIAMLKAIHGGGEPAKKHDKRPLGEKFRSIFAGIGTTKEVALQPVATVEAS
jgi:hypothetical protein